MKSPTGNTELIQTLNRFGHSLSYSQIEEIDTALCVQKLEVSENGTPLPGNIYPGIFTTVAWGSNDRLEETLSGGGTSHRVNGIAVQLKVSGPMPQNVVSVVTKSKKRSISPPPLLLLIYNVGQ